MTLHRTTTVSLSWSRPWTRSLEDSSAPASPTSSKTSSTCWCTTTGESTLRNQHFVCADAVSSVYHCHPLSHECDWTHSRWDCVKQIIIITWSETQYSRGQIKLIWNFLPQMNVALISSRIPHHIHVNCLCLCCRFKVFADYEAYIKCQEKVSALYKVSVWARGNQAELKYCMMSFCIHNCSR